MEPSCQKCMQFAVHHYWNHFKSKKMSFFKVLINDFSENLSIPKKFVANFKDLEEVVKLKGPSGNVWEIQLNRIGGETFLYNGWREFAGDHMLEEGDFLVFRYMRASCFKVQIFDMTGCEKEHCYFTRKRGRAATGAGEGCSSSSGDEECSLKEGMCAERRRILPSPLQTDLAYAKMRSASRTLRHSAEHQLDESEVFAEDVHHQSIGSMINEQGKRSSPTERGGGRSQSKLFMVQSNRRPVTEEEKHKALSLARAVKSTHPAFLAVMRLTNVYKNFVLIIPASFAAENLPPSSQITVLCIPGGSKTWEVNYVVHETVAKLGGGWKQFSMDNNLEKDDVCVFELISCESNSLAMDVQIFRVVDDLVPPTTKLHLQPPASDHQKKHRRRRPRRFFSRNN